MKGIYPKYRVFKEPPWEDGIEPRVCASYLAGLDIGPDGAGEKWLPLDPVQDFFFVLKPLADPAAQTALRLYAWLIEEEDPELAADLSGLLNETREDQPI